jgi:MFS family permease
VAGAQILGGFAAPFVRRIFPWRPSALIAAAALGVADLGLIGVFGSFWAVLGLIVVWAVLFAASTPVRQSYINGLIPSQQRATILSFDSLTNSTGGVWAQPVLGRAADVWGYGTSYVVGAGIAALAIPCLVLSRRQHAPADLAEPVEAPAVSQPA